MMNKINSVCVYCASSTKIDSVYFDAARELGALLGQRQIRLINGAGNMGLIPASWWSRDGITPDLPNSWKWKACTNGKRQWPT